MLKINLLRYETNGGPGVARQYGIDHTHNGYMTFIDADDTFNGAFALKALRNGLEMQGGLSKILSLKSFNRSNGTVSVGMEKACNFYPAEFRL